LDGTSTLPKAPVPNGLPVGVTFERFFEEAIAKTPAEEPGDNRYNNHEYSAADPLS